jgi:protein-S-isoprenylcysteine O-methyltransferase Ste14
VSEAAALLLFFTLFFLVAFVWPTLRVWRGHRVNALVLPGDDTVQGYVAFAFRLTLSAIFLLLGGLSLGLRQDAVGPLPWLEHDVLAVAGWVLLGVSSAWIMLAQAQMGASWRIGIDQGSRPSLVTGGLFALSRNPVFLGMRASLLGLFLIIPNAATLVVLLAGEVLMQVQVRFEEDYLEATGGADYRAYRRSVGRWLRMPASASDRRAPHSN